MNVTRGPRSCRLRQIVSRGAPRNFHSKSIFFNIQFIHLHRNLQNVGDVESLVYLPFRYMNQDNHRQ